MNTRTFLLTTGLALAVIVPAAHARQHEAPQAAGTAGQADPRVAQCAQAQGLVTATIEAAIKRLEEARLTNSPPAMRAAADDLEAALLDVRARLEPCAAMSVAADPQAAHTMPNAQQAPAAAPGTPVAQPGSRSPAPGAVAPAVPAPAGVDPHAAHVAPSRPAAPPAAAAPRQSPAAAPRSRSQARPAPPAAADSHAGHAVPSAASRAPATPAEPQAAPTSGSQSRGPSAADPHAGHVMTTPATPATAVGDLTCRNQVDPKTAPRMLFQGRMYYFCTESDRAEFAKDPGKYVKAPAQAAPAHAH